MRSRFRVLSFVAVCALLLGSCANDFGIGIADLPASAGWQPLPIGSWVLNDGIEARAMVFCPREVCIRQGLAALIAFQGERARRMEQALSEDPAQLARSFSRLTAEKSAERAAERQRAGRKPLPPAPENSLTDYARFDTAEAKGVLVTIRARSKARQGVTAILYGWHDDKLVVALGVSDEAEAAKQDAKAAWSSR
jgi:hypothetical protein